MREIRLGTKGRAPIPNRATFLRFLSSGFWYMWLTSLATPAASDSTGIPLRARASTGVGATSLMAREAYSG
jgi:hypothetical protein